MLNICIYGPRYLRFNGEKTWFIFSDIENNKVHGGCTRYFFCHENKFKRTIKCKKFIMKEIKLGLNNINTYMNFKRYHIQKIRST